jgi:DNA-directed RNA polymerase subunit RPC12/RpoP
MKKLIVFFIVVCVMAFSLTACQVNWLDEQFTVPWWVIVIPSVTIVAIAWFAAAKHITTQKYVCPECNQSFYPKLRNAAFSVHMNDDRVLKCPHCGKKGFCPPSRETKN